jgi:hypothetical protein
MLVNYFLSMIIFLTTFAYLAFSSFVNMSRVALVSVTASTQKFVHYIVYELRHHRNDALNRA